MGDFNEVVGLIGGLCGILVLLMGAFVYAKGTYSKARIEALREDNADLRDRVNDLEKKEVLLTKDVVKLQGENELLKGLVTQRAQVDTLLEALNQYHEQYLSSWKAIKDEIGFISVTISKLSQPSKGSNG